MMLKDSEQNIITKTNQIWDRDLAQTMIPIRRRLQ